MKKKKIEKERIKRINLEYLRYQLISRVITKIFNTAKVFFLIF